MNQLDEMVRQRQEELRDIDQHLFEELAKKKVMEQLLQDVGSQSSMGRGENSDLSNFNEVSWESESIDTQHVVDQIQKLRLFTKYIRSSHGLPQKQVKREQQTLPHFQHFVPFDRTHKNKNQKNRQRQLTLIKKRSPKKTEPQAELKQLTEEEIKRQYEAHIKTIKNFHQKEQNMDKIITLKHSLRDEVLKEERELIRKQLIAEQKLKKQKQVRQEPPIKTKYSLPYHNIFGEQIIEFNHPLKYQRNFQLGGLIGQFRRASRKADKIKTKIKTSSFIR